MAPAQPTSLDLVSLPVHNAGLTKLAFSQDGALIFTSGSDGIVRIFETAKSSDEEPRLLGDHEEEVGWMECSATHLLTSSTDSSLRLFTLPPKNQPSGPIAFAGLASRSTGVAIRCGVFDKTGLRIACASDDLRIKILASSPTSFLSPLTLSPPLSHSKPPRALAWSPDGEVLLSTGCEGNLIVWDASGSVLKEGVEEEDAKWDEPTVVKVFEGLVEGGEPEDMISATPVWHPGGKLFVVPSKSHEIQLFQRSTWSKVGKFHSETDGHDSAITELAFSPNGKYLASSGLDFKILIWEVESKKVIASYKYPTDRGYNSTTRITSLAFSPTSNLLAFTDSVGAFTRWASPVPSSYPHPAERFSAPVLQNQRRARSPLFGDDELHVDSHELSTSPEKKRRKVDEENDGMGDDVDLDGGERSADEDGGDGGYGEDWIIDDDEEGGAFGGGLGGGKGKSAMERWGGGGGKGGREVVNVTKAQPAFQPGSTSLRGKKRYLAFNMIGAIDITDQDTHYVVNVEFHDTSQRRGFHFPDHLRFEMAALGEKGAIFASLPDGPSHPSTVHYRPFDSWSTSSEWSYDLPLSEVAVAVAVGGRSSSRVDETTGTVVVATSKGYLRFLTGSGVQKYIWRMGEEVISMVGGKKEVLVVSREGGTSLDGCQNLRYSLIDLHTFDLIQEGRLPLGKQTTLSWVGFAEDGIPALYDSRGILSTLDRFRRPGQARWIPSLDTFTLARREGKDESYWAVGVQGGKFMAVILKGTEKAPYFPRPLISDLDINMPLLNMANSAGQLEENFLRQNIETLALRDSAAQTSSSTAFSAMEDDIYRLELSMDKHILTLIQTACKADKLPRALDAARLLNSVKSIDSAVQIAAFYHLPGLKEKISALKDVKEREIKRREDEERRARYGAGSSSSRYLPPPSSTIDFDGPAAPAPKSNRNPLEFAPRPVGGKRTFAAPAIAASPATSSLAPLSSRGGAYDTAPSTANGNGSYDDDNDEMDEDDDLAPIGGGREENDGGLDMDEGASDGGGEAAAVKRKRDVAEKENGGFPPMPESKKRNSMESSSEAVGPAPKVPNVNPFARKNVEAAANASSNPFAKSNLAKAQSMAKSNSFFDRVDEGSASSKKSKSSKTITTSKPGMASTGPKQLTLDGKPFVASEKEKKKRAPKKTKSAEDVASREQDESAGGLEPVGEVEEEEQETQVDEPKLEQKVVEEEEEEDAETQKDSPPPPKAKKTAELDAGESARSRLEKFRAKAAVDAPVVVEAAAVEEEVMGQEA